MRRVLLLLGLALCLLCGQPQAEAYGATAEDIYPQVVEGAELENMARQALAETLLQAEEGRRYEMETVHVPRELRLPEGDYSFKVTVPNGLRYWGNTVVQLQSFIDGKPFRELVCTFKLHIFDQVAVAARLLVPGEQLTEADFRWEEREIGASPRKFVLHAEDIVGKVLGRPVQPGQVIQSFMLHKPVLVESGKQVTILAIQNGVTVKMEGMALENGRAGKVIRVRNLTTKKTVKARVRDEHTVEALT